MTENNQDREPQIATHRGAARPEAGVCAQIEATALNISVSTDGPQTEVPGLGLPTIAPDAVDEAESGQPSPRTVHGGGESRPLRKLMMRGLMSDPRSSKRRIVPPPCLR